MDRPQYLVMNENTFGYIDPSMPNHFQISHASILRGATSGQYDSYTPIHTDAVIREATPKDFEDFRIYMKK